ncbi:MAG: PAS domain-containing protein [Bacteroidales bacterium]|nr:PAS domain-containing protein [Bacteroidales bacterium]
MDRYFEELPLAITISDAEGNILDMNQRSADVNSHGEKIIGNNLYNCHPPHAAAIIREMMQSHRTNAYTIEKNGVRKLIYQTPWYDHGEFGGLVELSIELPDNMPHYVRKPKES